MKTNITRVGGVINHSNNEDNKDAEEMDITKPLSNIKSIVNENEEEYMIEATIALVSITNSNKDSKYENENETGNDSESESKNDMDMTIDVSSINK